MRHEVGAGLRAIDGAEVLDRLRAWALELGFSQIGVADVDLRDAEPGLREWLAAGFHGSMRYMALHGMRRARPAELVPGTVRVITARMDYLPPEHWAHRYCPYLEICVPGKQAMQWQALQPKTSGEGKAPGEPR